MGVQEQEPSVLEKGLESEALLEQSRYSQDRRQAISFLVLKIGLALALILGVIVLQVFRWTGTAVVGDCLPTKPLHRVQVIEIVGIGAAARPQVEVQTKTPIRIQWKTASATPVPQIHADTKPQVAPKLVTAPNKR